MKYAMYLVVFLLFPVLSFAQNDKKKQKITIVQTEQGILLPQSTWNEMAADENYKFIRMKNSNEDTLYLTVIRRTVEELNRYRETKGKRINDAPKPKESSVFPMGTKVKFEKMKDMDGNRLDFRSDTSTVVVLNFWFTTCPPCKAEIPMLNNMIRKYKDNPKVKFIAISLNDEAELVKFLRYNPYNYQIIPDGRYYAEKYGVTLYPTHVVVGKDKMVKFSTVGLPRNTLLWLEKTIDEQL